MVFCLQKVLSSDSTSYVVEKIHRKSSSPLSQSFHSYLRLLYRLRGFEDEAAAYFRPYIQVSLGFISEDDP